MLHAIVEIKGLRHTWGTVLLIAFMTTSIPSTLLSPQPHYNRRRLQITVYAPSFHKSLENEVPGRMLVAVALDCLQVHASHCISAICILERTE
jgi:hypothetical protein